MSYLGEKLFSIKSNLKFLSLLLVNFFYFIKYINVFFILGL